MARTSIPSHRHPFFIALESKFNVMRAVALRDLRTRYFNHGLGFLIAPLWPLIHMGLLILIHSVGNQKPLYGESTALFFATGLVPTLTFMYVSRFMGWSLQQNRAMMAFHAIKATDVMFGRAFLEIISSCITLTLIIAILWCTDQNPWPIDLEQAVVSYLSVIVLAIGCGMLIGVIGMFQPFLITLWQISLVCIYISSGTMFVASNLNDKLSYYLSFSPVLECVEWTRTAFYESYSDKLVFPFYIWSFAIVALMLGLGIERIFRRQLSEG